MEQFGNGYRTYNWTKQLDSLIARAAVANKKSYLRLKEIGHPSEGG
jgi:hypothetical protein